MWKSLKSANREAGLITINANREAGLITINANREAGWYTINANQVGVGVVVVVELIFYNFNHKKLNFEIHKNLIMGFDKQKKIT